MTNELALRQRLDNLREQIAEVNGLLSDPDDNGAWCLGDPYELLSTLETEAAEIENELKGEK